MPTSRDAVRYGVQSEFFGPPFKEIYMRKLNALAARVSQSKAALVGGGLLAAGAARATDIDTTAVVAVITGGVTTVSAIGIAVLSLVVVIKLFKWVQRVL